MRKRFFYAGLAVLIGGLICAGLIYIFSADGKGWEPGSEIADRRLYEYQIQRIGGMAAVYVARFNQWLGSLWHGKQLAFTVGALAIAIALICFFVADMVPESESLQSNRDAGRGD